MTAWGRARSHQSDYKQQTKKNKDLRKIMAMKESDKESAKNNDHTDNYSR